MQTNLPEDLLKTHHGKRAEEILRKCVHCGFCNATCPTFQITGDELDGPRGRLYLIKEMLGNNSASTSTALHIDRCLTCLNCETTCPSGVKYGDLIEIGRKQLGKLNVPSLMLRIKRWIICNLFAYPKRLRPVYFLAKLCGFAPSSTQDTFERPTKTTVISDHKVILLEGCVQSVSNPEINQILRKHLADLNIETITEKLAQCCGALHHHNGMQEQGTDIMKKNIDLWWPHIEAGATAIVMTASGCGMTVKDYGRLMQHEPEYADKADKISEITKDACEFLAEKRFNRISSKRKKVAFHPPCTLQHGQQISGIVEKILINAGYEIVDFKDKHSCCGSAGTYSILQPQLASQLRNNKIQALDENKPDMIATANIGCLLHLQQGTQTPVQHWLELIKVDI